MSTYNHMDHAAWIESNCDVRCSDLGNRVAYIIGVTFGGIYNAPVEHDQIKWGNNSLIEVPLSHRRGMSSYDFSELTNMLLLCHELCIRVNIRPRLIGYTFHDDSQECSKTLYGEEDGEVPGAQYIQPVLELTFSQRDPHSTRIYMSHPDINGAVSKFRKWFDKSAREIATDPWEVRKAALRKAQGLEEKVD